MKLKGIKKAITDIKMNNSAIIYYNSKRDELFVTEHEIIFPVFSYEGIHCITQMMTQQDYRFDGTMNGLKTFMEANEHYFNKKGGE